MLVNSRLPFIEINTAGSAWLLELSVVPQAMIDKAEKHKYIRLSLGNQGDPNCFDWKNSNDEWTAKPPVRPGTCVLAVFDDELQSNLQLNVDTSNARSRKLRWELIDRASNKILLSAPFWEAQTSGQPLRVVATYLSRNETSPFDEIPPFVQVIRKLSPATVPKNPDGRPYVMKWIDSAETRRKNPDIKTIQVYGYFRPITLDWQAINKSKPNESWLDGYKRAYSSEEPVILNDSILIDPRDDSVRRVCLSMSMYFCSYAGNSLSDVGVLLFRHEEAYYDPSNSSSAGAKNLSRGMYLHVAGQKLNGEPTWLLDVIPTALPAPYEACMDFRLRCYFYPKDATTTAQDLVFRGVFGGRVPEETPRREYEYFVPLDRLPAVTTGR